MQQEYAFFVGVDWATEAHEVSIVADDRKQLGGKSFENTSAGLHALCAFIEDSCGANRERMAIGIEVPRGALVETLVERGFHVYSINPKQLDRFRDRHTPAGAKDDRLDAFVLADSLRTDMPCFRRVSFDDPEMIELRELSRLDGDLSETRNRLCNQLREQLMRYAPHFLSLCPAADEPWFWAFFLAAADPKDAAHMTRAKVKKLLQTHRIRRHTPDDVLAVVRQPALTVAPGTIPAAVMHGKVIISQLAVVDAERHGVRKRIDVVVETLSVPKSDGHSDAAILCSLPGIGPLVAATILSEAAQAIAARDYDALRAHAGVAPVTKRSGKRLSVIMRQACNERLRNALYHWARVSMQKDPVTKLKYASLRARGHSHGRALRGICDGLLRLLFGMLKSSTLFDAVKRQAAAAS
jgi:transposase